MRFHRSVLLAVFIFTFKYRPSNASGKTPSSLLEDSVKFKLRAAASLRDNLLKIFNQLQSTNYELRHSVQQVREYLKNGGTLIDSLHVLPTLAYVSIDKQINGILIAMEEHSPRYLLPAISVLQNACSCPLNEINFEDVLQPEGGPLRVDIFEGISALDLPKLTLQTPFPKDVERRTPRGQWPSFLEKVMLSISMGFLNGTAPLMELILENLISLIHRPQLMQSIEKLKLNFDSDDEEIGHSDLYESVRNVLSGTDEKSAIRTTADSILSYLIENSKTLEKPSKLAAFFDGDKMNYSLLLSDNKRLMKTKSAKTLLTLIQDDKDLLQRALNDLSIHEYSTPEDLLMAAVSNLRRHQAHQGMISEVVENVYEDLVRNSHHAAWKELPWSGGAAKTLLYGMKGDPNSQKIRRLAKDVSASIEVDVEPKVWPKIPGYKSPNVHFYGPSWSALQALEDVQKYHAIKEPALNASVTELVKTYKQYYHDNILDGCPNLLVSNSFGVFESTTNLEGTLNADDLMQAIPKLNVKFEEYIILRDFLASKDAEKHIGESIDVKAHPTRGRLLAWILGRVERSTNVKEEIRKIASRFVDEICYDGYGAVGVLHRAT